MKGLKRKTAVLSCVLLGISLFGSSAAAQSVADVQRAEAEFGLGAQAFEEGRYSEALQQMTKSYELAPNYRSAAGLGQVELHLGRFRDAAEHLDFSLRQFPVHGDPAGRTRVMDGLSEARAHVFTLSVHCEVSGAVVHIGETQVGVTPLSHDLYLRPGEPVLRVQAAGFAPFSKTVYAPAGAQKEVAVVLRPVQSQPKQRPTSPATRRHPWWVLGVGGGIAVAAAGGGFGVWLDARTKERRASSLAARLVESGTRCDSEAAPDGCTDLTRLRGDAQIQSDRAVALWVSATAVSVATTALFSWLELSEPSLGPIEEVALSPVVAPRAASLSLRGSF